MADLAKILHNAIQTGLKEGDEPSGWGDATCECRKCKSDAVIYRTVTSSCGGYEDEQYKCEACGHSWWVDGPDA